MQFSLTNTSITILFVYGFTHGRGCSLLTEESIDGLGSYFAYMLLLTIPSLGLSHDIFRQFSAELLALINGQKRYPLSINIL